MALGVWGSGEPPQISPRRALCARLVKGNARSLNMGPYYMNQGSCGRGGATVGAAVAALSLRACARLHCMAHGMPMQPSPKVPDGHSREPNRLHMIYDSCWEGVHAGRGPRSLFCGRAVGLAGGDRRRQVAALARPTRLYCSAMSY
jgi:hypothetical protein